MEALDASNTATVIGRCYREWYFYHICSSSSVVFSKSIWKYTYSLAKS